MKEIVLTFALLLFTLEHTDNVAKFYAVKYSAGDIVVSSYYTMQKIEMQKQIHRQ